MKLRNKLILSCAALAAVATTAVSTTFAWYVSNTTVTATGVTAGTDAAAATTLQISSDGSTWGPTVDINIDTGKFNPVSWGKDGNGKNGDTADDKFYTWGSSTNAVTTTEASTSTDYVTFTLYFRNLGGTADDIYLKTFEIKNTTAGALPTTRTLASDGLLASGKTPTNVPTFSVNLLRALDLKIDTVENTFSDTTTYNIASGDNLKTAGATTVYGLDAFKTAKAADAKTDSLDDATSTLGASANAHTYYNAAKGLTGTDAIATTDPLNGTTPILSSALATNYANANYSTSAAASAIDLGISRGAGETGGATYVKTTWTLFVNGWDQYCFDGIKGQTITLSLAFTTAF